MRNFLMIGFICIAQTLWSDEPIRIMPLGDSITQGDRHHNSYRRSLWKKLNDAGYAVDFVGSLDRNHRGAPPEKDFDLDHEGHWGWTADEILELLHGWIKDSNPDVVLMHLGTNDIYRGEDAERTVDDFQKIIATLRGQNPRVAVFVAKIIPYKGAGAEVQRLNTALASLEKMSTSESPILIVDLHTGFDPATDTYDGIHPNESGEEKMAAAWFEALKGFIKIPRLLPSEGGQADVGQKN